MEIEVPFTLVLNLKMAKWQAEGVDRQAIIADAQAVLTDMILDSETIMSDMLHAVSEYTGWEVDLASLQVKTPKANA